MADSISDASLIAALGRQMTRAVQKQAISAGNLANLDTPGFRAKDIQFEDALTRELGAGVATTHAGHLGPAAGGASAERADLREARGLQTRADGNNVQLDRELLNMTKAASDFSAAQTVLSAKFRLVRYAINEGR